MAHRFNGGFTVGPTCRVPSGTKERLRLAGINSFAPLGLGHSAHREAVMQEDGFACASGFIPRTVMSETFAVPRPLGSGPRRPLPNGRGTEK